MQTVWLEGDEIEQSRMNRFLIVDSLLCLPRQLILWDLSSCVRLAGRTSVLLNVMKSAAQAFSFPLTMNAIKLYFAHKLLDVLCPAIHTLYERLRNKYVAKCT